MFAAEHIALAEVLARSNAGSLISLQSIPQQVVPSGYERENGEEWTMVRVFDNGSIVKLDTLPF